MQIAWPVTTTVQPGHKIEITVPELTEGDQVEVFVITCQAAMSTPRISMLDFLRKPSTSPRSAPTWEEFERQFQEERNAWDR